MVSAIPCEYWKEPCVENTYLSHSLTRSRFDFILHLAAEVGTSEALNLLLRAIKDNSAKRKSVEHLTVPQPEELGNVLEMCLNEKRLQGTVSFAFRGADEPCRTCGRPRSLGS